MENRQGKVFIPPEKAQEKERTSNRISDMIIMPDEKYPDACALCGQPDTDKKWVGQFWHQKCLRKLKKGAKGML